MFTKIRKQESGFTIVELLIVIVVIGILAALVLNTFQGVQARARDTERTTDINSVHTHLEVYYNDYAYYPSGVATNTDCRSADDTADISCVLSTGGGATALFDGLDAEALNDPEGVAIDTAGTGDYTYTPASCTAGHCDSYVLTAALEDAADYTKNSLN
jgi:prepilin-type N-terminal cleavage/methylation domain-containing protein